MSPAATSLWEPLPSPSGSPAAQALTAPVGEWALSPDDAWLAWAEGPDTGAVHVTELASWRTVATLEGEPVRSLHWASPETLRVLRLADDDATLHAHAVPDGGELGSVPLPGVGRWEARLDASADGRVALAGRAEWPHVEGGAAERAYLVRGELGESTAPFDARSLLDEGARAKGRSARCAMSPDGSTLAAVFSAAEATPGGGDTSVAGAARVAFLRLSGGAVAQRIVEAGGRPLAVAWVGPSRVLVCFEGAGLWAVDVDGGVAKVAAGSLDRNEFVTGPLDVHPDRERALFRVWRGPELFAGVAAVPAVGRAAEAPELVALSAPPPPPQARGASGPAPWFGDACWSAGGELLTLTCAAGEVRVEARDAVKAKPRAVAAVGFPEALPFSLALRSSPQGGYVVVQWLEAAVGGRGTVRRIALVAR